MKMVKGKIYDVDECYDHAMHFRAEYHSSGMREVDGQPLHNMIIRMMDGSLEFGIFLNDDIKQISKVQVV